MTARFSSSCFDVFCKALSNSDCKTKLCGLSPRQNYTDRRLLSARLVPTFADTGCRVVTATNPFGRNLGFLDWSRYFFFQVAPQLYSQG
jgi:hypothetical protein